MLPEPAEGERHQGHHVVPLTGCTEKGTPPTPQPNLKKTSDKSRLEAILEDTWTVLLKAAKVMKNKKD